MSNKLAKLISVLFHPIFIPTYILLVLRFTAPVPLYLNLFSTKTWWPFLAIIFIFSAVLPITAAIWLKKQNIISNLEVSDSKERPQLFFLIASFYLALFYFLFSKGGLLTPTAYLMAIFFVNIVGLGIFTFKVKISVHASAIGGAIGIFSCLFVKYGEDQLLLPLIVSIIVSGVILSARLQLNAHNLRQVTLGLIWGLFCGIFGITILF